MSPRGITFFREATDYGGILVRAQLPSPPIWVMNGDFALRLRGSPGEVSNNFDLKRMVFVDPIGGEPKERHQDKIHYAPCALAHREQYTAIRRASGLK